MAEAQLRAELAETNAESQRLKERISVETPKIQRLIYLIPKWSGSEMGIPLEEFLSSIESSGRMGLWLDTDKLEITVLWLSDVDKQFHNGCSELHAPGVTWQKFKDMFRHTFRDTHADQYHFMRLQTARQSGN